MPSLTCKQSVSALAALTAALTLAACGSSGGSTASPAVSSSSAAQASTASTAASATPASSLAGDHNASDVLFAQGMILQDQQAVVMASYAATHASDARVRALAVKIRDAQQPEITTMNSWLRTWGNPTVSTDASTGSVSDLQMTALRGAAGTLFDQLFLQAMILHHQGATTMADGEIRDGEYGPAKQLAQSIKTSQTAEIATMRSLLNQ
ncbi:MAG: DUF305 domain-containing protein [Frankia sp.]